MTIDLMKLKLRPDALIEALVEVRFSSSDVPDIIPAKLSAFAHANHFRMQRLPMADMPLVMRQNDPALSFLAILQQRSDDGFRILNSGPQVFSWHATGEYPGWSAFQPEVAACLKHAEAVIGGVQFQRVGIRYINGLGPEHGICSLSDLSLAIRIGEQALSGEFNLNYQRSAPRMDVTVKLATPSFVQGATTQFLVLMDIDVSTKPDFTCSGSNQIIEWLEEAHMMLKSEFFAVLPSPVIENLAVV